MAGRMAPTPATGVTAHGRGQTPATAVWHHQDVAEAAERLGVRTHGLTSEEARVRLAAHGPNRLARGRRRSPVVRFLSQFHNLLIYILLACGAVSAAIGHPTDAFVIAGVVLLNGVIGFLQEGRAETALEAISGMIDPTASVLRDGQRLTIPAEGVVPGDVVVLEAGDRVAADLRLFKARNLRIDEAVLTGESVPADKGTDAVAADAPLGDRLGMAFSGTFVTAGHGMGLAVATGGGTELGRISRLIGAVERLTTPLVRQMDRFARQVTLVVLAVSAAVLAYATVAASYSFEDAFMAVIGLAVAAIPEGLPAVLTITLAVGVKRMARRNAIIRRLPAVETLGAVSVICSDKTGTLTRNEMTVCSVVLARGTIAVEGSGYRPVGAFVAHGEAIDPAADPVLEELTLASLLCNDAGLSVRDGVWTVDGDPMEGALVSLAIKSGHDAVAARERFARLDEIPFDSRHRIMATLHDRGDGQRVIYAKGAPERLIAMCRLEAGPGGARPIDPHRWHAAIDRLGAEGQRILALARVSRPAGSDAIQPGDIEGTATLLGLVGLIDPPRPEAVAAVAECAAAGIRVKMITGDHAATAKAIARQLGLAQDPKTVTGADIDAADDLVALAREATVFARTSPEHKLRLVEALQSDGSIIAMTGDGVNDAPALKRADVGVAMGGKGTEAAKEASEMVLADDNFASIVAAVREGRTVYDNLAKVIAWTLPTNGGEAFTIIVAILFGLALPVTPVQILWINMVTAVALGLTLAFEPAEPDVMRRPARRPDEGLLSARVAWQIVFVSALMVAGAFGIHAFAMERGHSAELARTMVVNTIVAMEVFYLFSVRFVHGSSLTWAGLLGTPAVLIGVGTVTVAQVAFTYLPPLQLLFDTRPVPLPDGLVIVSVGLCLLLAVEAEKRLAAAAAKRSAPA